MDRTGHYRDTSLLSYSFLTFLFTNSILFESLQSISSSCWKSLGITSQLASTFAFLAWGWSSAFLFLGVSISITSFSTSSISSSSSRSMTSLLWNKNILILNTFLCRESVSKTYLVFLGWDYGDLIAEFYRSFQYWATSFWGGLQHKNIRHQKPQISCRELTCCLLLSPFLATPLWAVYTWFSNSLYWPKVAVQTVHLYERWAGFRVLPWSLATWFNSFHWYTCAKMTVVKIKDKK